MLTGILGVILFLGLVGSFFLAVPAIHEVIIRSPFGGADYVPNLVRGEPCSSPCVLHATVLMGDNHGQEWRLDLQDGQKLLVDYKYTPEGIDPHTGNSLNGPITIRLYWVNSNGNHPSLLWKNLGKSPPFESSLEVTVNTTSTHILSITNEDSDPVKAEVTISKT